MLKNLCALQGGLLSHSFAGLCNEVRILHTSYAGICTPLQGFLLQSRLLYISRARLLDSAQSIPSSSIAQNEVLGSHHSLPAVLFVDGDVQQKVHVLSLLSAYSSPQYLCYGLQINCCVVEFGWEVDIIVATALVNMYRKCGSLEDARGVFDSVRDRDVILWTAIITAYAKRGLARDAMELFEAMLQANVTPDALSFVSILNVCQICPAFDMDVLSGRIMSLGFDTDFGVGTALLNLHVKRGSKAEAEAAFHKLPKHNRITWNSMISLYAHLGHHEEALWLYHEMLQEGLIPDPITFVSILQALSGELCLAHVRQLHVSILATQLVSNTILLTTLMNTYGKCKSAEGVLGTWECVTSRNMVVWSAFITMLMQLGLGQRALDCLDHMLEESFLPNEVTYTSALKACTLQRMLRRGRQLHACLESSGAFWNASLVTALLNLYNHCGHVDEIIRVFDKEKHRDVVLWTAAISAHISHRHAWFAVQLFYQMQEEGVLPNPITYISVLEACWTLPSLALGKQVHACIGSNDASSKVDVGTALINMYGKCGCLTSAHSVFDGMNIKDRLSWTAIISAYAHNGKEKETLHTFEQMICQGVLPDSIAFLSVMSACSHSGLLDLGIGLLFCMMDDFGLRPSARHYDCVIDLLGRAGQFHVAEQLLRFMPASPSEVSWTSMFGACRKNIDIHQAEKMAQIMLNEGLHAATPYVTLHNLLTSHCHFCEIPA